MKISEIFVHLMNIDSHREHRGEILCALCVLCGKKLQKTYTV